MLSMLLAYDPAGNVIATLDTMVVHLLDPDTAEITPALVDFSAVERDGAPLRVGRSGGVWSVRGAVGSSTWPEWIDDATSFRAETTGTGRAKRITALVHKRSGHRRERAEIEHRIAERVLAANGKPADIRDIVGGPTRPLRIDAEGKTLAGPRITPSTLPVVATSHE